MDQTMINPDKPLTIQGSITRDLSCRPHDDFSGMAMDLARKMNNANFLDLAESVEGVSLTLPLAAPLLEWLGSTPEWATKLFVDLQSYSQTAQGEHLLSASLQADQFWAMLASAPDQAVIATIAEAAKAWRSAALDEIIFDFHALPPPTGHAL